MDEDQQFCLRWNNHQSTLISVFDTLLEKGTLVDCTLAAEGQFLKAHKVVLSACSPYFAALLTQQYDKHPIFILKDVKFQELRAMMDYMYRGEVNISQDQLAALLKAAESLQIKGLSDSSGGRNNGSQVKDTTAAKQAKGSGLTIEQKMPRTAADMDADLSEAHEGSVSPNARKRKKVRRRSVETNNVDNHDHHSNSSSHSMPHGGAATGGATQQPSQAAQQQPSTAAAAATTMPTNITSATSSANVLSVTKKTDQEMRSDADMDEAEDPKKEVQRQNNGGRKSISAATPMGKQTTTTTTTNKKDGQQSLIEPKNEYDESNEETVEDLTLDEEEMMDDLDQAGPSHGGEGSSQGYSQWPVDRSQENDAFMQGQDGHHRDAQDDAGAVAGPSRGMRSSTDDEELNMYTVYEVDVIEELPQRQSGCILENDSIVVTVEEDKIKLTNWSDLQGQGLDSVDWLKKGEVDIIRCAKGNDKPQRIIPSGGVVAAQPLISSSNTTTTTLLNPIESTTTTTTTAMPLNVPVILSSQFNNGVAKKTTKNHPRIKYSVKQPLAVGQQMPTSTSAATMATLASAIPAVVPMETQKNELINFTLSRKFGNKVATPFYDTEANKVANVFSSPSPMFKTTVHMPTQIFIKQQPIETKIATISNEELQTSIISELSNYEIDEIELNPYQEAETTTDQIGRGGDSQSTTVFRMSDTGDDSKCSDSQEMKFASFQDTAEDQSKNFECRHCGKKYRWKSTLRRHENVECGGKEPSYQCPHCSYKAKQRGNLGVHIRKHHGDLPQLESRRKSRQTM